ncbi:oxidoreductase [Mycobacterium kyorinense]|uniref:Oxidoreductase n=1 Tax=Mycobacterium kyorinense TaxID=487514 RepID=A0A1A2YZW4_9MYCO|nr:SDR family NAD(P)-dependent oxidoreductase [Mycobacterium kyorinense]OBI43575.1 oxidoreductase [Mycobacterium kyorinense]
MGLALITGASSGIGLEIAKQFAEHGYDLVVAAEDDGLHTAAATLSGAGTDVRAVQVDLRTPDGVEELYQRCDGRQLDAAALNAGVGRGESFLNSDLTGNLALVDLNVRSTVHLSKLILADMVPRGAGKLLFTSSIAAMMPGSYQAVYNASKSFILSFAEALHDELRNTGVSVTSLLPGPTDTNFFRRAGLENTRMGRMPKDDPAEVAKQGFDALMRGERKVVAESMTTKIMGVANRFLPDSIKAAADRVLAEPLGRR